MSEMLMVGMAEIKTSTQHENTLVALGLGSCIGVCAHDSLSGVSGLVHIVLPDSGGDLKTPGKFADTAIQQLLAEMIALGACAYRIRIALAGGAQLFSFHGEAPHLDIGARNAQATLASLEKARLPVIAHDLGGNRGRSLHFYGDGRVRVRIIGETERELALLTRTAHALSAGEETHISDKHSETEKFFMKNLEEHKEVQRSMLPFPIGIKEKAS